MPSGGERFWGVTERGYGRTVAAGLVLFACALCAFPAGQAPAKRPAGASSGATETAESGSPLDLLGAHLRQSGDELRLDIAMVSGWSPRDLARRRRARNSYLCLKLGQRRRRGTLCLVPGRRAGRLALARPIRGGRAFRRLRSTPVRRTGPGAVRAFVELDRARVRPGVLRWRATSRWAQAPCGPVSTGGPGACEDALPDSRWLRLRVRAPIPVGCRVPGPSLRAHGSRHRRLVGLTFDDGPGSYTRSVLRILRRFEVHATFFQIGSQVPGGGRRLERKILREGNELADHTQNHTAYPDYGEIAAAKHEIRRVSGFTPCLFRPPGGGVNGGVIAAANANKLKTIIWDVDPRDWTNPGTGAIVSNVLANARKGSIVLLHDGGGSRSQTVAALPAILRGLRHRHLKAVSVTELLRGRFLFR